MKYVGHCFATVKALGFKAPLKEDLLLVISPVPSSLKPKKCNSVVPRMVAHGRVIGAKIYRAAVFVGRAVGMDRRTEGDGRHIGNMSLQMLESAIDWIELYGWREPYSEVAVQVGTMLMDPIQEETDGPKSSIGFVPSSSIATSMGWAEGFGGRCTGRVMRALLPKGSILLVANLHRGQDGRVLDQHPSEEGQAPVENEVADAVILPILCSD